MSERPGSRRSRSRRRQAPIKTGLDAGGRYAADRNAVVRLVCRVCNRTLVDFSRSMVVGDEAVYDAGSIPSGVVMHNAGPASDPSQRFAFDCACGRLDVIVRRDKIELATAQLLDTCRADDTPRMVRLPL
jgi:hypothetical protein